MLTTFCDFISFWRWLWLSIASSALHIHISSSYYPLSISSLVRVYVYLKNIYVNLYECLKECIINYSCILFVAMWCVAYQYHIIHYHLLILLFLKWFRILWECVYYIIIYFQPKTYSLPFCSVHSYLTADFFLERSDSTWIV